MIETRDCRRIQKIQRKGKEVLRDVLTTLFMISSMVLRLHLTLGQVLDMDPVSSNVAMWP